MIVVATRMSNLRRMNASIVRSSASPPIWPWAMAILASGTIDWILSATLVDVVDPVVHEVDLAVAVQLAVDRAA